MSAALDTFMTTMVAQARPVSIEHAVALAREHFGLETRAEPLTGERDENFRLSAADGAQYVLKIANPAEDPTVTALPAAALLHVARIDSGFPCPRLVPERAGNTHVHFKDQDGVDRMACVLTYLPGRLLGRAARSPRQRAACGRMAARLTRALSSFQHPAAHRAVVWDVRHTAYIRRLLGQLPDLPCRHAAADVLARIVPAIESRLPPLRAQVVHNDMNPLNILVDPADETRVVGVIDFGDITHTALIADLAVAAAELIAQSCPDAAQARESVRDVAVAYHESVPLLPQELALLGALVAARLVMNVVVHEWHVRHNPANDHHAPLDADFIAARLAIAAQLSLEEIRL
jgi:hydroxylysine kinase